MFPLCCNVRRFQRRAHARARLEASVPTRALTPATACHAFRVRCWTLSPTAYDTVGAMRCAEATGGDHAAWDFDAAAARRAPDGPAALAECCSIERSAAHECAGAPAAAECGGLAEGQSAAQDGRLAQVVLHRNPADGATVWPLRMLHGAVLPPFLAPILTAPLHASCTPYAVCMYVCMYALY
jgi:hypothetical protein